MMDWKKVRNDENFNEEVLLRALENFPERHQIRRNEQNWPLASSLFLSDGLMVFFQMQFPPVLSSPKLETGKNLIKGAHFLMVVVGSLNMLIVFDREK